MSDVYLTRVDASQNMARYYRMTVHPTLFGEWSLVREWGRLGRGGQVRANAFLEEADALDAMMTLESSKVRKCYCPCQAH
jgi:predicted DNA-binding WGR domain protein